MRPENTVPPIAGSTADVLPSDVAYLDEKSSIFEKMLDGWDTQMTSRNVKHDGRHSALATVRRLASFTNSYPWEWTPDDFEAWSAHIFARTGNNLAVSSMRNYQGMIRRFNDFIVDPRYGWLRLCVDKFGKAPSIICNEFNTFTHTDEFEGKPTRRALTYEEVERFFDASDSLVSRATRYNRKGGLVAMRNSAIFKAKYVFGPRISELCKLDVPDCRHQANVPEWGTYGSIQIRYGKAKRGGAPRRRTVLLVPEFSWLVEVLDQYTNEVRPQFDIPRAFEALWVSERGTRVSPDSLELAFKDILREADLDPELEPHCLRHSFCTHLLEFGYAPIFVQRQMGHSWASTSHIYSHVSDAFMMEQIDAVLAARRGRHS